MEEEFAYPEADKVVEFNLLALGLVRATKGDKHEVLSHHKLEAAIEECRIAPGDLYSKAAVLMKALCQAHAFASGNRRTAFITVKYFLGQNGGRCAIPDDPLYSKVMRGIREGRYSIIEIAEWIKNGRINQTGR